MQTVEYIWKNGQIQKWNDSVDHVLTHSLHYGTGVFEGIRFYNTNKGPAIFRLKEHIKRLFDSASTIGMKVPYTQEEIINATIKIVKENKIESGYIRPLIYYGYGKMGLDTVGAKIDVIIATWPWGAYLGEEGKINGISAKISDYSRHNQKEGLNLVKATGFYINSMLAKMDALNTGFNEAILLDGNKNIAECSGENIFVIKNNIIYTPTDLHCLRGITRDSIMQIAKEKNIDLIEKDISKEELFNSDGVFLSGTAAEITSVVSVDNKKIGEGKIHPIAKEIQDEYDNIVRGKNELYNNWLTFVEELK